MSDKSSQRKAAKQARLDLTKDLYQAYSDTICLKLMNLDEYIKAENILAYCPVNNEVDTSLLLEESITNKTLSLPRTDIKNVNIIPCVVHNLSDLKIGAHNIMEPNDDCKTIDKNDINIVVVPLVAFDKKGTRIGYGGGYYDRFLNDIGKCKKIGIAFSLQEIEQIEKEHHDVKLDMIITEKKIYKF